MDLISRFFGHKETSNARQQAVKPIKKPDIGVGHQVKCRVKGDFFQYEWTYRNAELYKPKCNGCGRFFDVGNDEDRRDRYVNAT